MTFIFVSLPKSKKCPKKIKKIMSSQNWPTLQEVLRITGSHEQIAYEHVSTLPEKRIQLLVRVRDEISRRLRKLHYRYARLSDLFANMSKLGQGEYGETWKGCLRKTQSKDACQTFDIKPYGQTDVLLAVKTTENPYEYLPSPYTAFLPSGEFIAHKNPIREALSGRMLNYVVRAKLSPHFPAIYDALYIGEKRRKDKSVAIVMEMADMTLQTFITQTIKKMPTSDSSEFLRIIILQVMQGLATAQEHLLFFHNDLHSANIMLSFVDDVFYTYKADGKYFRIPTHGMNWKIIDFGFGTSDLLYGRGDTRAMVTALSEEHVSHPEVLDMARILKSIRKRFHGNASISKWCDGVYDILEKEANRHEKGRSVMRSAFVKIAAPYKVPAPHRGDIVFDMDAPLFTPRSKLQGLEAFYYHISRDGKLVRNELN